MDAAKNFAKGTLAQGYDDTATSIVLTAGDGARFPTAPFNATWWNATDYPDPSDDPDREIVRVTARSTDTLTVTRGQEGTGGVTHSLDGKSYKLVAGLTAKLINDHLLDVTRTGDSYEVDVPDTFTLNAVTALRLAASNAGVALQAGSTFMEFGDVDENNSGVKVRADDNLGQVSLTGKVGTNQTAAASTLGSVTKKLEVFDLAGNSLGFIPIYGSIT